jgi:hypothetical protein
MATVEHAGPPKFWEDDEAADAAVREMTGASEITPSARA